MKNLFLWAFNLKFLIFDFQITFVNCEILQIDEDVIQYEDMMAWFVDAESQLVDVHKRFKYRGQDYGDLVNFKQQFAAKQQEVRV